MLSILLLSACLFRRAARGTLASSTIVASSRTRGALILALTRDANSFHMYHTSHLAHALLAAAQCLLHSPRPRKVRPSHLAHLGARHHRYPRTLCADVRDAGHPPTPSPHPIPILLHPALTPSLAPSPSPSLALSPSPSLALALSRPSSSSPRATTTRSTSSSLCTRCRCSGRGGGTPSPTTSRPTTRGSPPSCWAATARDTDRA